MNFGLFRSVSVHFGSPSQNVLKLILKVQNLTSQLLGSAFAQLTVFVLFLCPGYFFTPMRLDKKFTQSLSLFLEENESALMQGCQIGGKMVKLTQNRTKLNLRHFNISFQYKSQNSLITGFKKSHICVIR